MTNKILIITCYDFPCYHSVVENLFAKELGKCKDVYFIFYSLKSYKDKVIQWHNAKVILLNKNKTTNIIKKFINNIKL